MPATTVHNQCLYTDLATYRSGSRSSGSRSHGGLFHGGAVTLYHALSSRCWWWCSATTATGRRLSLTLSYYQHARYNRSYIIHHTSYCMYIDIVYTLHDHHTAASHRQLMEWRIFHSSSRWSKPVKGAPNIARRGANNYFHLREGCSQGVWDTSSLKR